MSKCRSFIVPIALTMLCSCDVGDGRDAPDEERVTQTSDAISSTAANKLITDGRAALGTKGGVCKVWVQSLTKASYNVTIPSTDTGNQWKWTNDSTPATNVARWLGSYANGRTGSANTILGPGQNLPPLSVTVPNADQQMIVVYASTADVLATLSKGATTLSVTSSGKTGGTLSATTSGQGTWTLNVKNQGAANASGVVAVVISRSRFVSDWQTARKGDIIQMFGGTSSSNRNSASPHTTFIQTDFNANGGTSCSGVATGSVNNEGCNWLDSNWATPEDQVVRAHNISMETMIEMMAFRADYGFTVYRLN